MSLFSLFKFNRSRRRQIQFLSLITLVVSIGFIITSHFQSTEAEEEIRIESDLKEVFSGNDQADDTEAHLPKVLESNIEYDLEYRGEVAGKLIHYQYFSNKTDTGNHPRENATFFSVVRNSDMYGILKSIRNIELRFNKNYHYDWVFANDETFSENFITIIANAVSGNAFFVDIPQQFWSYPSWIDVVRAAEVREKMGREGIKYGDSEAYRHMCRFNSGFFQQLDIMQNYKYYWRVEPNVEYWCDMNYDAFKLMREHNKTYGFNMAPLEIHTTVVDLWESVKIFQTQYPHFVSEDNNMAFLTEDEGENYNMCHFWSNFEIGDLDFFRSDAYMSFFDHLDQIGGFFYERWGDAPVHSVAVSLLQSKDKLHFFQDTGYFHSPNGDCPLLEDTRVQKNCVCAPDQDYTWSKMSCIPKWFDIHGFKRPEGAPDFPFENQHYTEYAGPPVSDDG